MSQPSVISMPKEYIPDALEALGLEPFDYRVVCHVARRAGKNGSCYEAIENMAKTCLMSAGRVKKAIAALVRLGVLVMGPRESRRPLNLKVAEKYRPIIPAALDDMGLDVHSFRLYVWFQRVAKKSPEFTIDLPGMSKEVKISVRTIQRRMAILDPLVKVTRSAGVRSVYRVESFAKKCKEEGVIFLEKVASHVSEARAKYASWLLGFRKERCHKNPKVAKSDVTNAKIQRHKRILPVTQNASKDHAQGGVLKDEPLKDYSIKEGASENEKLIGQNELIETRSEERLTDGDGDTNCQATRLSATPEICSATGMTEEDRNPESTFSHGETLPQEKEGSLTPTPLHEVSLENLPDAIDANGVILVKGNGYSDPTDPTSESFPVYVSTLEGCGEVVDAQKGEWFAHKVLNVSGRFLELREDGNHLVAWTGRILLQAALNEWEKITSDDPRYFSMAHHLA